MKKLCKIIPIIGLIMTLTACANEPSRVPEPPILSNSGESSVNSPIADILSESMASDTSNVSAENGESSSNTKTESTSGNPETTSNNSSAPTENSENISDTKQENTTSSFSESNLDVTSNSSTTKNDPIIKENPGMFDLNSKTVTLNSGYVMPINGHAFLAMTVCAQPLIFVNHFYYKAF